jgi:hypothetical protein
LSVFGRDAACQKAVGRKEVEESIASMPLDEIRKMRAMTQLQLSEILSVHQSEISKVEHRSDICVSTLADYIEALGGHLEIRAVFPDRAVVIDQFASDNG